MNNLEILKKAGITVPDRSTSYHTDENGCVVFCVNRMAGKYISGSEFVTVTLTQDQIDFLRINARLGSFGWAL